MSKNQRLDGFLARYAAPLVALLMVSAGTALTTGCGPGGATGGGGAGGHGSMASTGTSPSGAGGAGGQAGCVDPSTCPGNDTECETRTCTDGQCGLDFKPNGMPTPTQMPSDCKTAVCDGNGGLTTVDDTSDVLDDKNPCTADTCAAGSPVNTPSATGTACNAGGGKVCDGQGACVECVSPAECASSVCQSNQCVPATCVDTVKNGMETDVDCGGTSCGPCDDGKVCALPADCKSGVCTGNACQASICSDGVKNGLETDIDCGGPSCAPCATGQGCKAGTDCVGGACSGSVCLPTCTDTLKNNGETDVDCGGAICAACADGKTCLAGADCTSKVCTGGVCKAPTCSDGVKNAAETDVDCGGGTCPACVDAQACNVASDCVNKVCTGNLCQPSTCADGVKNGLEADVDCGGPICGPCGPGQVCGAPSDCSSHVCTGGVCAAPVCGDGVVLPPDACDDGNVNNGDGCSATCSVEPGFNCAGTPSVCTTTCGDGIKAGAEACDDSNMSSGDGCSSTCAVEAGYTCSGAPSVCTTICGDGILVGAEQCDDGNVNNTDGCSSSCTVQPGYTCNGAPSVCVTTCGDGIKAGAEACDDGGTVSGDGCSGVCAVETGYSCSGSPSVCAPICGDTLKVGAEQCDDGNVANNDCCSSTCQIEAGCEIEANDTIATANDFGALSVSSKIKGFIKPATEKDYFLVTVPAGLTWTLNAQTLDNFLGVTCASNNIDSILTIFDANAVQLAQNDDNGSNNCSNVTATGLVPGQYYVEVKSYNAASSFAYTMQVNLTFVPCGDNIIQPGEQCDDGNNTSGDGCSATCKLEAAPEAEPNGTCAQANGPFLLGSTVNSSRLVTGTITPAGDNDWYSFTIPVYADVRFETFDTTGPGSCTPSTVDTEIQIFAADCVTAVTPLKDQGGILNCSKIDPNVDFGVRHLAPGTYYVKVIPYSVSATFGYDLQVTLLSSCGNNIKEGFEQCDGGPACDATCLLIPVCGNGAAQVGEQCDDGNTNSGDGCSSTCQWEAIAEVEPNGTTVEADAAPILISGNTNITGGINPTGDKDIFKLNVAAQSTIRFEIFDSTGKDCVGMTAMLLKLLNSGGLLLKQDIPAGETLIASGIDVCPALAVNVAPGTYYIQAEKTTSGTIAAYFLRVTFEADAGAETEPNDTQAQANSIAGNDTFVFGGHQVSTDLDWYQVTVPIGASIRAETIEGDTIETCESNGVDSTITLFNSAAVSLGNDGDDGRGYCSAFDGTGATPRDAFAHALVGGTYFIQVKSFSTSATAGNMFNYRLVVTIR